MESDAKTSELEPPVLGHAQWHAETDARYLLMHAARSIPRQHLCMVLAEFAEELWPRFHRRWPHDWRLAWCIATVRAWCLGAATLEEVRAARSALAELEIYDPVELHAAIRVTLAAADHASDEGIEFASVDPLMNGLFWAIAARHHPLIKAALLADEVAGESDNPVARGWSSFSTVADRRRAATRQYDRDQLAQFSESLRARIPWPPRPSERWIVGAGEVKSGDATLVVDGWRIVDARAFAPERRGRAAVVN